jgi:hypothetical protein
LSSIKRKDFKLHIFNCDRNKMLTEHDLSTRELSEPYTLGNIKWQSREITSYHLYQTLPASQVRVFGPWGCPELIHVKMGKWDPLFSLEEPIGPAASCSRKEGNWMKLHWTGGEREGMGVRGKNGPNNVCTYE